MADEFLSLELHEPLRIVRELKALQSPNKIQQDQLDSLICLFNAICHCKLANSMLVGHPESGQISIPYSETLARDLRVRCTTLDLDPDLYVQIPGPGGKMLNLKAPSEQAEDTHKKARTYLPNSDEAPEFIRRLYTHPPIDFEQSKLDGRKLQAFERLVTELNHDFTVYSGMFGTAKEREQAAKLGSAVVAVIERSLLTQICLRFAALTADKDFLKHRGGKKIVKEEVVSFKELIEPLSSQWLDTRFKEMDQFYSSSGLKTWRNKVIAHNDLNMFYSRKSAIPQLTQEDIYHQLSMLNDCVNYLNDRQDVHTEVEVQLPFGEGLDKFHQVLKHLK